MVLIAGRWKDSRTQLKLPLGMRWSQMIHGEPRPFLWQRSLRQKTWICSVSSVLLKYSACGLADVGSHGWTCGQNIGVSHFLASPGKLV